jgi:hypothetical protein
VPGHLMDVSGQLTSFTNIGTCECTVDNLVHE